MSPDTFDYLMQLAAVDRAQKQAARNLTRLQLGADCPALARHEDEIAKASAAIDELLEHLPKSEAA